MDEQDIIDVYLGKIERLGYEILEAPLEGPNAVINTLLNKLAYNPDEITPYDAVHEYFHAINGDTCRCGELDVRNPLEGRANIKAIKLLWELFLENGGSQSHFTNFLDITGCPRDLTEIVISSEYNALNAALNAMDAYEDTTYSTVVQYNGHNLQELVENYIEIFDITIDDEWFSIYDFLDFYGLSETMLESSSNIFDNLLDYEAS